MPGLDRDAVDEQRPASSTTRPCSRRARRSSRRSRSRGRRGSAASRTAALISAGSSGSIGERSTLQPASRAWAASISELVSTSSPGAGSAPIGRPRRPSGSRPRAARAHAERRVPRRGRRGEVDRAQPVASGNSSSVALTSSPIVRTCCHGAAAAARTSGTPSSQCTCSRITTASKPSGSASPVSTTAKSGSPRGDVSVAPRVSAAAQRSRHRGGVVGGEERSAQTARRSPARARRRARLDRLQPLRGRRLSQVASASAAGMSDRNGSARRHQP